MIVKCTKTGKILATDEEIREHSEAFGVGAFEEIAPDDTKIWMSASTGKYCFSKNEMDVFCKRTGEDASSFDEITVTEFLKRRQEANATRHNDPRVEKFANDKLLGALVDVKGFTVLQAEKALWFTKNESLARAEEWLREHSKDPDFNVALKLTDSDVIPVESSSATLSSETKTIPLEEYVNADFLTELLTMGFPRERCLRSLWKTENAGVANAVDWLTAHADDMEEEPLPDRVKAPATKLSKEAAQQAALELQRKLREERLVREAAEAKEKERTRVAQTKAMLEQQSALEEQKRKREIADRERAKREEEAHRAELAERLRLDYIDRFGREPEPVAQSTTATKPKDRVLWHLNQIRKSMDTESARSCLSTLRLYLANIESNSAEKKFHRIKKGNKVFSEKVGNVKDAVELLKVVGFVDDGDGSEFMEIKTSVADGYLCGQAVKYIDVILNSLQ